jgi:Flp pilus assembly protein TadD
LAEEVLLRPDDAVRIAMAQFVKSNAAEAENILRAVLEAEPRHAGALAELGVVVAHRGEFYEALYRLDRALKINRRDSRAHNNRGMVLGELGHHDEALAEIEIALVQSHDSCAVTWNNKGNTLIFLNRNEEAVVALRKAIRIDPKHVLSWYNLGIALQRLGRSAESVSALERAIELQPGYPDARFNLSMAQLSLGDYEAGWRNYEARWETADYGRYHKVFPQPLWRGEDIAGKSIMVYGDQGYGDAIMFARYLPMIVATGAEVYCNIHRELRELFARTFANVRFLDRGDPVPAMDYRCALASAPQAFGTRLDTIPAPTVFRVPQRGLTGESESVSVCNHGNKERSAIMQQMRPPHTDAGQMLVQPMPCCANASVEAFASTDAGSEIKGHLPELRRCLFEEGQAPEDAVREMRGDELANAPSGLQQAIASGLVVPSVSSGAAQNDLDCSSASQATEAASSCLPRQATESMAQADLARSETRLRMEMRLTHVEQHKNQQLRSDNLKVGLCWSGNWKHVNDAFRSIPFRVFQRLLDAADVTFVNLQKDVRPEDDVAFVPRRGDMVHPVIDTWANTFAVVQGLDLVITVDTAIAHAAATQGVPTWILLPTPRTDWRWLKDRADSPWYPSVRLIRQERPGDWRGVIERVRRELAMAADGIVAYILPPPRDCVVDDVA